MRTQAEKTASFRALHQRPGCFLIPNPWDAGTAKILAGLGYEALATTSLGVANILGRKGVTRAEVIANAREIVEATDLPVNADLENCFAHEPAAAAETIRLAAEAGLAGGSIEDYSGDSKAAIYDFDLAASYISDTLLRKLAFAGTPTEVAEQAIELYRAGATRIEFGTPHGLSEAEGLRLLGESVLPALRHSGVLG